MVEMVCDEEDAVLGMNGDGRSLYSRRNKCTGTKAMMHWPSTKERTERARLTANQLDSHREGIGQTGSSSLPSILRTRIHNGNPGQLQ